MAISASRSRVRQVWRSSWQVPWTSPARARAPARISSRPSAERGLSTSGPLQRDEDPVGGGVGWTLMVHVLGHGGEERARHRDQALVAALALRHEHPPLAQAQVPELKTENLASPQAAEQHGLDHGAVASGA